MENENYVEAGQGLFKEVTLYYSLLEKALCGDAEAMWGLGDCYYYGRGVAIDHEKALDWYEKSTSFESPTGYYCLGRCYEKGLYKAEHFEDVRNADDYTLTQVEEDPDFKESDISSAVEFYRKAAELDCVPAKAAYGRFLLYGASIKRKFRKKGLRLLEEAALAGNIEAAALVGDYYFSKAHWWKIRSYDKAFCYLGIAASAGDANSLNLLGILYAEGKGVKKDLDRASYCFEKAKEDRSVETSNALMISKKIYDAITYPYRY